MIICEKTMEYYQNLIFNFASIIATVLFVSAAGFTIFRKLKFRWPMKVNCWFCNSNTKVYHDELNWWLCPTCEQYNGFTKDGDYAYDIPEQSTHISETFAKPYPKHQTSHSQKIASSLCERCNHNEELKIFELRTFDPKGFFQTSFEQFKQQLEMKYPLCDDCKVLVQNVLQQQSLWLTRYKMLFFKQKSVNAIIHNAKTVDKVIRVFLTVLTSVMICYPNDYPLSFIGIFLQLITLIINQAQRSFDAILILLWICVTLVSPLKAFSLLDILPMDKWSSLENIKEHHIVSAMMLMIGITNITSRFRSTRNFKAAFKKLESPNNKNPSSSILNDSFEDFTPTGNTDEPQIYTNYHQVPTEPQIPIQEKTPTIDTGKFENRQTAPSFTTNASAGYSDVGRRHILKFDGNFEQYSLNDSLSTLKTLTLGESRSRQSVRTPNIFQTKVYGSTSPDLFQRTSKSSKKFILAPPKLKSVTQTSWVAGGYWQVGGDSPTLSRSSSQSSGFGSAGSNFGPSREPSVTKEVDKCSVMSDNTQFCCTPQPNSVNSINSCCTHGLPIHFARCDNAVYNHPLKIMPNSMTVQNSQSHFSPVHPESSVCYEHCFPLQNPNITAPVVLPNQQISNCSRGCSNVLNSHAWLSILLCGSFVFNIAVFCMILLR